MWVTKKVLVIPIAYATILTLTQVGQRRAVFLYTTLAIAWVFMTLEHYNVRSRHFSQAGNCCLVGSFPHWRCRSSLPRWLPAWPVVSHRDEPCRSDSSATLAHRKRGLDCWLWPSRFSVHSAGNRCYRIERGYCCAAAGVSISCRS